MNSYPYDGAAQVLAAKIAEATDLRNDRLGLLLAEFAETIRREADAAAVARMSRPMYALTQRIEVAERRAARVTMLDSTEGLLAIDLKWACEELRKRDDARAAPPEPPPGRVHEIDAASLLVRSCTDRALCPSEEAPNGRTVNRCPGCGGSIVVTP